MRVTISIETLSAVLRMYGPSPRRLSRSGSIKERKSGNSMFKRNGRVMVIENGAEIDVKASLAEEPAEPQFLCLTISNTRGPGFIAKPEDCFIPFKQKGGGQYCFRRCLVDSLRWLRGARYFFEQRVRGSQFKRQLHM